MLTQLVKLIVMQVIDIIVISKDLNIKRVMYYLKNYEKKQMLKNKNLQINLTN